MTLPCLTLKKIFYLTKQTEPPLWLQFTSDSRNPCRQSTEKLVPTYQITQCLNTQRQCRLITLSNNHILMKPLEGRSTITHRLVLSGRLSALCDIHFTVSESVSCYDRFRLYCQQKCYYCFLTMTYIAINLIRSHDSS